MSIELFLNVDNMNHECSEFRSTKTNIKTIFRFTTRRFDVIEFYINFLPKIHLIKYAKIFVQKSSKNESGICKTNFVVQCKL